MGRLRLFGEPEGGGTDDHSALSNLAYADSGHSGFVPSQGEALIDILRLNQNLIRDSGGNDRLTLSPASPHVAITGDLDVSQHGAFGADAAVADEAVIKASEQRGTSASLYGLEILTRGSQPAGYGLVSGLYGMAKYEGTGVVGSTYGLFFRSRHASASMGLMTAIYADVGTDSGTTGIISSAYGLQLLGSWLGTKPGTLYGIRLLSSLAPAGTTSAYGLCIEDMTAASVRLLELGPTMAPYLRLTGGGNPPTDKSNLYLKFGSTFYRVVKSGNYMTLEAA